MIGGVIYAESRQAYVANDLHYLFDENGTRIGFVHNGTNAYYYRFNLQGDVTGIYSSTGNLIVEYTYDAISTDGNPAQVKVPPVPSGKKMVAAVHTHPYLSGYKMNEFSDTDKEWAKDHKVPLYLLTPRGDLKKYNPKTGEEDFPIFDDLPRDPRYR